MILSSACSLFSLYTYYDLYWSKSFTNCFYVTARVNEAVQMLCLQLSDKLSFELFSNKFDVTVVRIEGDSGVGGLQGEGILYHNCDQL